LSQSTNFPEVIHKEHYINKDSIHFSKKDLGHGPADITAGFLDFKFRGGPGEDNWGISYNTPNGKRTNCGEA
jgi:hypothetical protein